MEDSLDLDEGVGSNQGPACPSCLAFTAITLVFFF